ncbi:MAG: TRAP transporter small permease [Burkholderiaceae bacterium]
MSLHPEAVDVHAIRCFMPGSTADWRVENGFTLFAAFFIFGLMRFGMGQVLGRQLLNMPISGYIDFVEISMSSFAFLAIAYCQRVGGHVRMDLFVNKAKGRLHWGMEAFGTLVAIFLIAVLIWYGWDHFMRAWESGDSTIDTQIPVWPSKLAVPLAFGLLLIRLLVNFAGYLRLIGNPALPPVAVPRILTVEEIAAKEIEDSASGK